MLSVCVRSALHAAVRAQRTLTTRVRCARSLQQLNGTGKFMAQNAHVWHFARWKYSNASHFQMRWQRNRLRVAYGIVRCMMSLCRPKMHIFLIKFRVHSDVGVTFSSPYVTLNFFLSTPNPYRSSSLFVNIIADAHHSIEQMHNEIEKEHFRTEDEVAKIRRRQQQHSLSCVWYVPQMKWWDFRAPKTKYKIHAKERSGGSKWRATHFTFVLCQSVRSAIFDIFLRVDFARSPFAHRWLCLCACVSNRF